MSRNWILKKKWKKELKKNKLSIMSSDTQDLYKFTNSRTYVEAHAAFPNADSGFGGYTEVTYRIYDTGRVTLKKDEVGWGHKKEGEWEYCEPDTRMVLALRRFDRDLTHKVLIMHRPKNHKTVFN